MKDHKESRKIIISNLDELSIRVPKHLINITQCLTKFGLLIVLSKSLASFGWRQSKCATSMRRHQKKCLQVFSSFTARTLVCSPHCGRKASDRMHDFTRASLSFLLFYQEGLVETLGYKDILRKF